MVPVPRSSLSWGQTGAPSSCASMPERQVKSVEAAPCPGAFSAWQSPSVWPPLLGFRMSFPFPLMNIDDCSNSRIFLLSYLCWTWDKDPRAKVADRWFKRSAYSFSPQEWTVRIPECLWAEGLLQDQLMSRRWGRKLLEPRASVGKYFHPSLGSEPLFASTVWSGGCYSSCENVEMG